MQTIPLQNIANTSEKQAIFNTLKAAIEQQEGIEFRGVLQADDLKVNEKPIEVKNFKSAVLYADSYFAVVLYHFKKGLLSYQFDLVRIDHAAVLSQEVNLSGQYVLKFSTPGYAFSGNIFHSENAVLTDFHQCTQKMAAQSSTETDLKEKWLKWAFRSLGFGLFALIAFWVFMGFCAFSYDSINNSTRVFFILIPFGALYSFLKGTLALKILYFLSFVGITFLTFLGAIADAKKGRELIETIDSD